MSRYSLVVQHDPGSGVLDISAHRLRPPLRRYEQAGCQICLIGTPICRGRGDDDTVVRQLAEASDIGEFSRSLDGNFLILINVEKNKTLQIVSDRFASHAFYYSQLTDRRLIGSLSLSELVSRLGRFDVNETALVEFLHFRRIFGEKTYDKRCSFLGAASVLEHSPTGIRLSKYWQPNYRQSRLDLRSGADAIADGLRRTMQVNLADAGDARRYALFMSGGLDSRALLMAAAPKPLCITTCVTFNNEAVVAQEVAKKAGADFLFIPQPLAGYDAHIADAVFYGGGQHLLAEAHFIDYGPRLESRADCFFLGLGLDVFFGGLYLPKHPVRWLRRDALHFKLDEITRDLTGTFIAGVKYRLQTSDPWSVIKAGARVRLQEAIRCSIDEIVVRGRNLGADGYDLWEYLHLHNFSRHYSFLMINSIRHWGECRVPALCNDLFDAAIALPAELKANSSAYLKALNQISPALMRIRNANTNISAGMPFARQSVQRAARIIANKYGGNFLTSPPVSERSWPSLADTLRASPALMSALRALPQSEQLEALGIIDLDRVRDAVAAHLAGRRNESTLLLLLVTLDEFARHVR